MIKTEIQQRAFKNTLVGLISFIFSLAQAIISVPVLLKYWGNETYGIWLALFAGYTLLQSLDTGHINYLGNKLNILYNINKTELKNTLSSGILFAIVIGTFQILILLFLIITSFLSNLVGLEPAQIHEYSISISLMVLIISWLFTGSVGGIIHRLMVPTGFYYQSQWWGILYRFFQFLSIVIVAVLGGSILEASIFYVITQFIIYGLTFLYIKYKIPEFFPWWQGANIKVGFNNFKESLVLTYSSFIQHLNNNGIILFVSNIFSSILIPVFTSIRTMTNTALSITNIIITSLLPDFVRYHASGEKEKIYSVFNANWFFSGLIVNLALILIMPFAERIFQIWTRGIIIFDFDLFITLAASISVINFGAGFYNYLYGINNLKSVSIITTTRIIILFTLSYYFSGIMDLSGIGAAVLLSEIFSSILLPYYFVNNVLKSFKGKLNIKSVLIALISPCILTILAFVQLSDIQFSYIIWGSAFILIILAYLLNWFFLDPEVKVRTKNLMSNLF